MKSWDPFRDLVSIQDRMNKLFESVLSGPVVAGMNAEDLGVWRPAAEVVETPEGLELSCDLAGIDREDVHLSVDGSVLTVEGERTRPDEAVEWTWHRLERSHGKFLRRFELPGSLDLDSIDAAMADGVLTVTLRRIPVA